MAGQLSDNPFAHLAGAFFTARSDPAIRATPGGAMMHVWQSIYSDFQNAGQPLPAGAFQAVNQMWTWTSQVTQADRVLSRGLATLDASGQDQAIHAGMIADALNARPLDQRPEGSQFRAIYRTVYSLGGETFTDTFTHDFGYSLPATLDQLNAETEAAAALQVSDYGYEWEGVAVPISIRAY